MNKVILSVASVVIVLNLIVGAIISSYTAFNIAASTIAVVATVVLCLLVSNSSIKDGFKVSLYLLFAIAGAIEFLVAAFMPSHFTDNWWLIAIFVLLALEVTMLIGAAVTSQKISD